MAIYTVVGAVLFVAGVVFRLVGLGYWLAFIIFMSPRSRHSDGKIPILRNFFFLGSLIVVAGLALMEAAARIA